MLKWFYAEKLLANQNLHWLFPLFYFRSRSDQLYHITTCIKLKLLIMEMNFQNFRNAEPWVAFRFVEYQTIHWFKPCLSDKYRFCLFLKNCDEWIKYKVNFVESWFARRVFCNQVKIIMIPQGCLGILPWHCGSQICS